MVARVGGTPSVPSGEPSDSSQKLAKAFGNHLGIFQNEIREVLKNPHLADTSPTLQDLAQSVINLANLANQAALS